MGDWKLIDHTDDAKRDMAKAIERALDDVGIHLEGAAAEELQNSPMRIDTGLLRNSITHAVAGHKTAKGEYQADRPKTKTGAITVGTYSGVMGSLDEKAVYIGTNVEYAIYVHEGTSRMAPNRFLKNAVTKNEEQIRRWLDNTLRGK